MPAVIGNPSDRSSLLHATTINSIFADLHKLKIEGRDIVSLIRGEPDLPTPPHIIEAGIRALRDGRTTYPDNRGEARLREAVAVKLVRDNKLSYDPDSEILVTSGATFGIYAALSAVLNDGDEVMLPNPIYDAYQSPVRLAGGRARSVQAQLENNRFCLSREALENAWTPACKVLLLNTPWNPVGTIFTEKELADIGDFLEQRNLLLVSDEIYEAITYKPHQHISPAAFSLAIRERCILVNSLSKTYSMTGWRVGYCAAAKHLVQAMLLVLQQSSRGPALFVQDAAATALIGPQDCVTQMRNEYTGRRAQILKQWSGASHVSVLPPEGGFFAMLDIRGLGLSSENLRRRLLQDKGVAVVHGAAYGEGGEGMLRISFASGGENLTRGLDRLRDGLKEVDTGP